MITKEKFKVIYSEDASRFLERLPFKVRDKILFNISKSRYIIDPKLFKKLDNSDIWEFRTKYNTIQYRLLAFWDHDQGVDILVIVTHAFIKKTQKTPSQEINKAIRIKEAYFNSKSKRQ